MVQAKGGLQEQNFKLKIPPGIQSSTLSPDKFLAIYWKECITRQFAVNMLLGTPQPATQSLLQAVSLQVAASMTIRQHVIRSPNSALQQPHT